MGWILIISKEAVKAFFTATENGCRKEKQHTIFQNYTKEQEINGCRTCQSCIVTENISCLFWDII